VIRGEQCSEAEQADIVYLKSILDDEGMNIAQVRAGAVYSART
jgi:hypothetical protein